MKKSFLIVLLSTFIFVVRLSAQNLMKFELHEDGYWITDFGTIGSTLEIPAYYNNQKVVQSQVYRPAGDENCKTIIFSEGMETWCDQMDFSKSFQNVEKIVIPSTMKHIGGESGYSIFHNKPNLREIDVSHKNEYFRIEHYSLYMKEKNSWNLVWHHPVKEANRGIGIPSDIKYMSPYALYNVEVDYVYIPNVIGWKDDSPFTNGGLEGLTANFVYLEPGIKYISPYQYLRSNVKYIYLPSSIDASEWDKGIETNTTIITDKDAYSVIEWASKSKTKCIPCDKIAFPFDYESCAYTEPTENIRMRYGPSLDSSTIISIQKGSLLEQTTGVSDYEIIDGIFSRWVKVRTCNGARDRNGNPIKKHTEGWCFGGYLKRNTFYKN